MFDNTCFETELHFSTSIYETIPILDIKELLTSQKWNLEGGLSHDDLRDISEGIRFITIAEDGYEVVNKAKHNLGIEGNTNSVFALLITQRALRNFFTEHPDIGIKKLLTISKKVLKQIYHYSLNKTQIKPNELEMTIELFTLLSKDSFLIGDNQLNKTLFSYA